MIVEICANSFESANAAAAAGAHRIELCTALAVGGITPSWGLIEKVTQELDIPVHVLIRPRSGNFTYIKSEVDVMLKDIKKCEELGCAGVVTGALTETQEIDMATTRLLKKGANNLAFTFHRAFDWCPNALHAVQSLKDMGVDRLLSSGQAPTAAEGIQTLLKMKEASKGTLQIMPGGGISIDNIDGFITGGFEAVHFSATKKVQTLTQAPRVSMHGSVFYEEGIVATSDESRIRQIIERTRTM